MESPRVTIESDSFQRASFGFFSGARRVFQLWNEAQKKHLSFVPKPIVEVAGGVSRVEMNAKNSALDIPPATTGALSRKTVDRSRRCHTCPSDEASLRTAEKCDHLCDVTRGSKSSEGMKLQKLRPGARGVGA